MAVASLALLVAVAVAVSWVARPSSSELGLPSTVWAQQVVEPGVPAGWSTPVGQPLVSGDLLAVTVGEQLTLLSRSSGTVEAQTGGVVGGEVAMLGDRVALSTEAGVQVFDRDGLGLVRGLGPRGPIGGAGNTLLLWGPAAELQAMDVGREPPVVVWDAEIPGGSGSVIAGPVVVPSPSESETGTVVISRGRQVTTLDLEGGSRQWSTQLPGPAAVGWLVASPDTGLVYALDGQGVITALDLRDGSRRWSIGSVVTGRAPHVQDQTMVVRMSDGRVALFDAVDGEGPLWSTAGQRGDAGPVLAGDAVLVGDETRLVGLDVDGGGERWSVQLLGQPSAITSGNGVGYVTASPGIVYAIDNGQVRWRTIVGNLADEQPGATLAAGPSLVLARDRDGSWRAVDAGTGRPRWTYRPDDPTVTSPPTVDSSRVYLTSDSDVIALDPNTGEVRWRASPGFTSRNSYPPAVGEDRLVVVQGPAVVAYTLDGEELWRHTFEARDGPVAATIEQDTVYVTTRGGVLLALSASNGEPRWELDAGIVGPGPPDFVGGSVIAVDADGTIRRFDPDTGRARWRSQVNIDRVATTAGLRIHGLQDGNIITAVDPASGTTSWTHDLPDHLLLNGPVAIGHTAIVATAEGTLIAIEFDGDEAWRLELGFPILTPPVTDGRRLYVRDINGRLHALE